MSFLLWQRDQPAAIGSTRVVFRASEVPLLADAHALCERLNTEHAAAADRIATAANVAREAAYAKGYAEGREEGRDSIAETLTALHQKVSRERETLRANVASLALEVVRKIAGALDAGGVIAALAANAARDLVPAAALTLLVHASRVDAVRAHLAAIAPDLHCDVRGDANVAIDACCLATEHGSIDASLGAQLDRIAAAWEIGR